MSAQRADRPKIAGAITGQPVSQTVLVGQSVTFSVTAPAGSTYQWYGNNILIAGKTGSSLTIPSATVNNVATYHVAVTYNSVIEVSHAAFLSVIEVDSIVPKTVTSAGRLTSPAGIFHASTQNVICDTLLFTSSFTPGNASQIFYFYGPNVPNQSGPFQNNEATKLTITTQNLGNPPGVNTCVRLLRGPTLIEVFCEAGLGGATGIVPALSPAGNNGGRYQLVVYSDTLDPNAKIAFHWKYEVEGATGGLKR